jgi:hypothetical protein
LILVVVLVIAALLLSLWLARMGFDLHHFGKAVLWLGIGLAVVRIGIILIASLYLLEYADWRQVLGSFAMTASCLLELSVVRELRGNTVQWLSALSTTVLITSLAYSALLLGLIRVVKKRSSG